MSYIKHHPILKRYHEQFQTELKKQNTRLLIVGYGFQDDHINDTLVEAAKSGGLRLYIVDPNGTSAIENNKPEVFEGLRENIAGVSQRNMRELASDGITRPFIKRFLKND